MRLATLNQSSKDSTVQIYTARANDLMPTTRHSPVDLVVLAPDTCCSRGRGNASVATKQIPDDAVVENTEHSAARLHQPWFQTWSQKSCFNDISQKEQATAPTIICDARGARILVSPQLQTTAPGVYAAGSVAAYPNVWSGTRTLVDGSIGGVVAARNMVRDSGKPHGVAGAVMPSFPVWHLGMRMPKLLAVDLASFGMQTLSIGCCDAVYYATHGVWWTRHAAWHRRVRAMAESSTRDRENSNLPRKDSTAEGSSNSILSSLLRRQWTTTGTIKQQEEQHAEKEKRQLQRKLAKQQQRDSETSLPVYGRGVIYYVDEQFRIQGIRLWGLPFESKSSILNHDLLLHMQRLIESNGGFQYVETDQDHMRFSSFLEKASRELLALSLSSAKGIAKDRLQLQETAQELSKPLYRIAETHRKKRIATANGDYGEFLFQSMERRAVDKDMDYAASIVQCLSQCSLG